MMLGARAAAVPALLLVLAAALAPLARAQKPTWNDVTFDPSIDRRNDWCPLMAQGNPSRLVDAFSNEASPCAPFPPGDPAGQHTRRARPFCLLICMF